MLNSLEIFKSTENFADVTLACEGRILKAHKLVLAAGSHFFHNLFMSNPCNHPIIIMHDVQHDILKAIIEFMYKGEVNVMHNQLQVLLKTARNLDVKGLAEICQNSVASEEPVSQRRKKIRLRKRSCDSTFSNEDVIPLKTEDLADSGNIEPLSQNMTATEEHSNVEPLSISEQNEQAPLIQSLKSDQRSEECLYVTETQSPGLAPQLDANDSEGDCDIKPPFLPLSGHLPQLSEADLMSIFQRCRHPSQFAVNIARLLFTPEELRESNCRGVKDKIALDRTRLDFIKSCVIKFYHVLPSYELEIWKQCMQSIDSRCRHERRPKYKNSILEEWNL